MNRRRMTIPTLSTALLLALAGCAGEEAEAEPAAENSSGVSDAPDATEPTPAPADASTSSEPAPQATPKPAEADTRIGAPIGPAEGILMAVTDEVKQTVGVLALDPATSEAAGVAEYGPFNGFLPEFRDYPIELQDDFTPDFSRMAAREESGLGWFEDNGQFVNVTAQMSTDQDEFAEKVSFYGGWFDDEGNYHFGTGKHREGTENDISRRYMVPAGGGPEDVKDMGASRAPLIGEEYCRVTVEGALSLDDPWCTRERADATGRTGPIADWISDNEFLFISSDQEAIARDVTHPENTFRSDGPQTITPDARRRVVSAAMSPDGTQVVFLSPLPDQAMLPDEWNLGVYIMPADGSANPTRLDGVEMDPSVRLIDWL